MKLLDSENGISIYQNEVGDFLVKDNQSGILEIDLSYKRPYLYFLVGWCYENEKFGFKKDKKKAFYWFSRAAEEGEAMAQSHVGYFYQYGIRNVVEKSAEQAEYWYRMAADQHDTMGLNNLGDLLISKQQYEEAEKYLLKAFAAGVKSSRPYFHLGRLYEATGKAEKAKEMYSRAAAMGDEQAAEKLEVYTLKFQHCRETCVKHGYFKC